MFLPVTCLKHDQIVWPHPSVAVAGLMLGCICRQIHRFDHVFAEKLHMSSCCPALIVADT